MTESKPPFSLIGIDPIVLLVKDFDGAMRFCREVLGRRPGYSYPKFGMVPVRPRRATPPPGSPRG